MPEHIRYEDDDLFNPETHHESTDVPVRPLFWLIGIFIIFAVVSHFALWFLYKAFVKGEQKRQDPAQTMIARPADASVPQNQPLLQPFPRGEVPPQRNTPVTDLVDMRAAEDKVLQNYGWVDKQRGIVHIPIEKAKELAAARLASGTPASTPAGAAPSPAPVPPSGAVIPPDTGGVPPATQTTTGGHQ
jgi:hypothetical protein